MRQNKLSASSIAAFKTCSMKYRLAYDEGLRPITDTDSLRTGSSWHRMHELYSAANALDAVIAWLNQTYSDIPAHQTAEEFALEREILLQSFLAYHWYYQNEPLEVLHSELPFELPLTEPRTGMKMPVEEVVRVGKIDKIVRHQGSICAFEMKSTSRSVDPASDYWERWRKDSQIGMYALAFRDLGLASSGERGGNTLVDIWKKPTIRPAMLTQKETGEFLSTMTYCGKKFDILKTADGFTVNSEPIIEEVGKKATAWRETIAMFGARLQADMQANPEKYFARREIARTDKELAAFEEELYAIYQAQKLFKQHGTWFSNESACRATYACPYIPICFGPGAKQVSDGSTTPPNYKRVIVDLTIKGQGVESE